VNIRIIEHQKEQFKHRLHEAIENGNVEEVESILEFDISNETIPQSILEPVYSWLKQEMPMYNLFHKCITDVSQRGKENITGGANLSPAAFPAEFKQKNSNRVKIARKFLSVSDPYLDFNSLDENGLSILHKSVLVGDLEFAGFIIKVITNKTSSSSSQQISLNLNSRCKKKGWAPIHYAVEQSNIEAIHLLANAGANLSVTSATDRKLTPLELAKLKSGKGQVKDQTSSAEIVRVLSELITGQKSKKEEKHKGHDQIEKSHDTESRQIKMEHIITPVSDGALLQQQNSSKAEKDDAILRSNEKKKKKAEKKKNSVASEEVPARNNRVEDKSSSLSAFETNVACRDEIVDRLLSMGFLEQDCLAAICLYGTDIDKAISWLCEVPPKPTEKSGKIYEAVKKPSTPETSKSSSLRSANNSPAENGKIVAEKPPTAVEEVKRISKSWNMRLEEEKRKVCGKKSRTLSFLTLWYRMIH
jgi:hypothetical protein